MKRSFTSFVIALAVLAAQAEESTIAVFNFAEPETLNPAITKPEKKESVALDGRSFTAGNVKITFTASESGNTHVRLYTSYDAGCDVRIYDGEMLTVESTNPDLMLDNVQFEMSLSGSASGSNDINFVPSVGTFTWEDELWTADENDITIVDLTSFKQSRLASMTVTLKAPASISTLYNKDDVEPTYYTLRGIKLPCEPTAAGVYIRVAERAEKIVKK
jgi:hypothetical protein